MEEEFKYKREIIWKNVIMLGYLHTWSIYSFAIVNRLNKWTMAWSFATGILSGLGITAGVHRLWTHKSYKAKLPLQIFLAICNTIACQNSIYDWARDHRVHHKYSDTQADPHNSKRGLFYSHVGWLMVKKHPATLKKGKSISMEDLRKDPVVMFQKQYYRLWATLVCFVIPTAIPMLFWRETLLNSYSSCLLRYCLILNLTWCVNSAAHKWGNKPYDTNIKPRENMFVVFGALGEGFHNYHHVFPHDYATSEFGSSWNFTTAFINAMASIGQAYDLRTIPSDVIHARTKRTGDYT